MANARFDLRASAHAEMLRHGFASDFPADVLEAVAHLTQATPADLLELRHWPWSSIDNSSSKDLDQIECAEREGEDIRISVAIADVDAYVPAGSAIDRYAQAESTSVYVPGHVFPMLPDALSNGLTSLLAQCDRAALVISMRVAPDGSTSDEHIGRALVRNGCQLQYGSTGAWLEKRGPVPEPLVGRIAIQEQLWIQNEAARRLRNFRVDAGALFFERAEPVPVFVEGQIRRVELRRRNRAADLIEELMIAANEAMARFLNRAGVPNLRRVLKTPEQWPRIAEIAAARGTVLPQAPDSRPLALFLKVQSEQDPDNFADLSLSILKLLGTGEYVVAQSHDGTSGHFALATGDYAHSTAPNRRFADLVTQRIVKGLLSGASPDPYTPEALQAIAQHCTERDDAARKVERAMHKRVAAFSLRARVGQSFRGIVTGVTPRGVFVRLNDPPVEGRVMQGERGLNVGDRIKLRLMRVDPEQGYIDFANLRTRT